jgi:hypothetical protein
MQPGRLIASRSIMVRPCNERRCLPDSRSRGLTGFGDRERGIRCRCSEYAGHSGITRQAPLVLVTSPVP